MPVCQLWLKLSWTPVQRLNTVWAKTHLPLNSSTLRTFRITKAGWKGVYACSVYGCNTTNPISHTCYPQTCYPPANTILLSSRLWPAYQLRTYLLWQKYVVTYLPMHYLFTCLNELEYFLPIYLCTYQHATFSSTRNLPACHYRITILVYARLYLYPWLWQHGCLPACFLPGTTLISTGCLPSVIRIWMRT